MIQRYYFRVTNGDGALHELVPFNSGPLVKYEEHAAEVARLEADKARLRDALRGLVSEIRIDPTMDSSIRVRGFRQGAADALRVAFKVMHEKGEVQS